MLKTTTRLFLLAIGFVLIETVVAAPADPTTTPKTDKSDSLTVKEKQILPAKETASSSAKKDLNLWNNSEQEEVEEDSTSNSALSFNFIYYIIEKFKFQVE